MSNPAAQPSEADLFAYRDRFPILADSTYLLSHSMGAMPGSVRQALLQYTDEWARDAAEAWEVWMPRVVEIADRIGRLIGAPAGSVSLHQNVSVLMAAVASTLDFRGKRNKVVYSGLNFPTVDYIWTALERQGARVQRIASADGITIPLDRMLEAIDETTVAVPISHVIYKSSFLQDVAAITRRAHEVGAMVVLDAYQTVGCVPMDVTALGIDYLLGGSHKWLCGGPGTGFLYARPDVAAKAEPTMCGWFSHAAPFAFEPAPIRYAPGALRFLGGTPGIAAFMAAAEGHKLIEEVTVARIRQKSQRQTELIRRRALDEGYTVNSPADPTRRGGSITVELPGSQRASSLTAHACKELIKRRVFCDHRPGAGIRVSAHFYTTDAEIDRFFVELADIRQKL
jgi:kynureninase